MLSMISLHFSMIFLGFPEFPRYVDELSKLQDSMPADSLELVEKLLTKDRSPGMGISHQMLCAVRIGTFSQKTHHERRVAYFRRFGDSENCGGLRFHRVRRRVIPSAEIWCILCVLMLHSFTGPGAGKHLAGTHSAGSRASAGQRDHCAGHQQMNWQYA